MVNIRQMYLSCLRYLKAGVRNAASKSGALKNIIESQSSTTRTTTRKFLAVRFEISSTRALHTIGNYKRSRSLKFIEQRRCLSTVPVSPRSPISFYFYNLPIYSIIFLQGNKQASDAIFEPDHDKRNHRSME